MTRRGHFTWLHHDIPVEYTWDLDERLAYIRENKPTHEITPRLAAIVEVPESRLPPEVAERWRAYDEAGRAYDKARQTHDLARRALYEAGGACDEVGRAYDEAGRAYVEARCTYDETKGAAVTAGDAYEDAHVAYDEAGHAHAPALLALARELAPHAPYNPEAGCLVFPREEANG